MVSSVCVCDQVFHFLHDPGIDAQGKHKAGAHITGWFIPITLGWFPRSNSLGFPGVEVTHGQSLWRVTGWPILNEFVSSLAEFISTFGLCEGQQPGIPPLPLELLPHVVTGACMSTLQLIIPSCSLPASAFLRGLADSSSAISFLSWKEQDLVIPSCKKASKCLYCPSLYIY